MCFADLFKQVSRPTGGLKTVNGSGATNTPMSQSLLLGPTGPMPARAPKKKTKSKATRGTT